MKHFSTEDWLDFVRGVVAKDRKAAMQNHLSAGCKQCDTVVSLWKRVHIAAQRETAYEPPAATLRTIKAMYSIHGKPALKTAKAVFAQLLFDSLSAPLQAGVRSSTADARQLLYGSGDHRIDLRFEPQVDSDKISLVGQLLNSADPARAMDAVPVDRIERAQSRLRIRYKPLRRVPFRSGPGNRPPVASQPSAGA